LHLERKFSLGMGWYVVLIWHDTNLQKLVSGKKKIILTSLVFRSNTLNILTRSHLSSHLLVVLAKLKPTPNKTNSVAQSKYIYIYQKNKQNKTAMIVSRIASESIWNINETEDSNKNRKKNMQNDETTPNICWIWWK
jgi:hypothetical protein